VAYRTAFREIVKLLYAQKIKPTVEGNHILLKWYTESDMLNAVYVRDAYTDAVEFVKKYSFDFLIPRGLYVNNNEIIMCIPSSIEKEFVDLLVQEEECVATFIKHDDLSRDDFTDSFVYVNKTNKGGVNKEDYIIVYTPLNIITRTKCG
jgi:hypothetical protein